MFWKPIRIWITPLLTMLWHCNGHVPLERATLDKAEVTVILIGLAQSCSVLMVIVFFLAIPRPLTPISIWKKPLAAAADAERLLLRTL